MVSRIWFSLVCFLFTVGFSHAQKVGIDQDFHPNRNAQLAESKLYKKRTTGNDYDIQYHRMELNLNPDFDLMSGAITSYFAPLNSGFQQLKFDLIDNLEVDSVHYRGIKIGFTHPNEVVEITLPQPISAGVQDSVTIYYHGNPTNNPFNSYGREKGRPQDPHPLIWTLSEPYGAFAWWPCKQSLTDKIDSLDMLITMPKGNKAAGNGLLIYETEINDSQIVAHWKHRYPIATYLVAVAVTNYEEFTDVVHFSNGDSLPILNYIFPEYVGFGREPAKETVRIMQLFDSLFGPYPFKKEKYGHAQFLRGGGMEHQTMSFMVDWNFGLVAHELAHQWFGDQITCGSWSDLWLNEGFATYLTLLSYQHLLGQQDWIDNNLHSRTRAMELKEGSVFVQDTLDENRLFSSRLTYNKGAQVLHMMRCYVGDSAFFSGIRNYLADSRLSYGFALNTDLKFHLEQTSGKDLTELFNDWIFGEGYPEITATWNVDGQNAVVRLQQKSFTTGIDHYVAPVEVLFTSNTDSAYYRLQTNSVDSTFILPISFNPDSMFVDPNYWILSKNTVFKSDDILKEIRLFPNPSNTYIDIDYGQRIIDNISIYDATGKMILSKQVESGTNKFTMDISHLVPGMYYIKVEGKEDYSSIRFLKI